MDNESNWFQKNSHFKSSELLVVKVGHNYEIPWETWLVWGG